MAQQQNQKQAGSRKCGRNKRRIMRKGGPMSLYVRGKISFGQYAGLMSFKTK